VGGVGGGGGVGVGGGFWEGGGGGLVGGGGGGGFGFGVVWGGGGGGGFVGGGQAMPVSKPRLERARDCERAGILISSSTRAKKPRRRDGTA